MKAAVLAFLYMCVAGINKSLYDFKSGSASLPEWHVGAFLATTSSCWMRQILQANKQVCMPEGMMQNTQPRMSLFWFLVCIQGEAKVIAALCHDGRQKSLQHCITNYDVQDS